MKKITLITFIAAFAFGFNPLNSHAQSLSGPSFSSTPSGSTSMYYEQISETLIMRMVLPSGQELVDIKVLDDMGKIIHGEKALVHARGTVVEISLAGHEEGLYFLEVRGSAFDFSERFKKN